MKPSHRFSDVGENPTKPNLSKNFGEKQNQTTRLFVKGKVTYVGAVATRVTENALPALQSRVCLEQVKSLFVQAYLSVNKQVRIKPPKFYQLGKRQS